VRTVLNGLLVVAGGVILSIAGLLLVRKLWPALALSDSNEIGDDFITVLGTAYGVLVAFVVSTVWGRFTDAEREADTEANEIFTLLHLTDLISTPNGRVFHDDLIDYTHSLLEDEWALLARGRGSTRTQDALQRLWATFRDISRGGGETDVVLTQALQRLEGLTDSRRLRLFNSDDSVPTILWVLLLVEGVITVVFTYLLVAPNLIIQLLMTAALAATIGTSLYLIAALNHPFAGIPRVTEANLRGVLRDWETRIETSSHRTSGAQ